MFFDRLSEDARDEIDIRLEELESEFRAKQAAGTIPEDDVLVKRLDKWIQQYA